MSLTGKRTIDPKFSCGDPNSQHQQMSDNSPNETNSAKKLRRNSPRSVFHAKGRKIPKVLLTNKEKLAQVCGFSRKVFRLFSTFTWKRNWKTKYSRGKKKIHVINHVIS
ncbi:hypothetical protein CDAR_106281 [Caerostris darwini]|uniref:Uncharacterized protein n=1 Tax=Caerostris darwini TaxID=1538125 RepID=A0AAV4SFB8_9ARAC|nr:hypothetical protein CDAR_106281 [Caerostris darwini]